MDETEVVDATDACLLRTTAGTMALLPAFGFEPRLGGARWCPVAVAFAVAFAFAFAGCDRIGSVRASAGAPSPTV